MKTTSANKKQNDATYGTIFRLFLPEFITALLLYSVPFWLDAYFISHLNSTTTYATLGASNNFLNMITKIGEAFSVSAIIISGQLNGREEYEEAGYAARDVIGITGILGLLMAAFLYAGAPLIYRWHGFSEQMIAQGIPFMRLRALSVLFMFLFFAGIGFLRGIKNTRVPMKIFIAGTIVFVLLDYGLIFGKFGLPAMELRGSALASVVQYGGMLAVVMGYIFFNPKMAKYRSRLFSGILRPAYFKRIASISWPIVIDKAVLAGAYIWLCKMICPMGECGVATYSVVKDMERFAFLPAIALAHVVTLLASNDYGCGNWDGIKSNIRRILFLASGMVFVILVAFSLRPEPIIRIFDRTGEFTGFAAQVFPLLSVLVFFDLLQLILSGALRGVGNTKTVMIVRLAVCFGFFVPLSYSIAHSAIENQTLKFLLIYGSFYLGNALMSLVYIGKFRRDKWKQSSL